MAKIKAVHAAVDAIRPKKRRKRRGGLSSGSTVLNLALTDTVDQAFFPGCVYHLVGDSSSGKSFATLTCMAEARNNPAFAHYDLVYDDAENGAGFDFDRFFPNINGVVRAPRQKNGEDLYSAYLEDFYDNLDDLYRAKRPFIYVLDSMDVLWPRDDSAKFDKQKKLRRKKEDGGAADEKESGTYGMAKAKLNSQLLRVAVPKIRKTGSIVIIVSQAKTNIDPYSSGKTNSGGLSLKFYASAQMWSSVGGHYKRKVNGRERELGIKSIIAVKKNRHTGKDRKVMVPFYHSAGLDDTGGMVEYLLEEGHWSKGSGGINAKELGYKGNLETLVKQIEDNGDVPELKTIVKGVWDDIESKCVVRRRNRYGA